MSAVRCSACDTVFDGSAYTADVQTHGHPDCPNPVCNPTLAAKLAEKKAKDEAEHLEYLQWKADKAAGLVR